jgi:hypothetical protein
LIGDVSQEILPGIYRREQHPALASFTPQGVAACPLKKNVFVILLVISLSDGTIRLDLSKYIGHSLESSDGAFSDSTIRFNIVKTY